MKKRWRFRLSCGWILRGCRLAVRCKALGGELWTDGNRVFRQDLAAQHIEASRYAAQLDCYLEHFPREDFLLMRF